MESELYCTKSANSALPCSKSKFNAKIRDRGLRDCGITESWRNCNSPALIAPLPILQAILEHSDIAEAAVVGMPDKTKGQIPVGLCVLKAGK